MIQPETKTKEVAGPRPVATVNVVGTGDIGIPNGPAEYSTRGLLKAHYPKNKKIREPKMRLRKK
jgi:hypothetical protein